MLRVVGSATNPMRPRAVTSMPGFGAIRFARTHKGPAIDFALLSISASPQQIEDEPSDQKGQQTDGNITDPDTRFHVSAGSCGFCASQGERKIMDTWVGVRRLTYGTKERIYEDRDLSSVLRDDDDVSVRDFVLKPTKG
jgi:hypothetical protein